jgi:ribosomal protein L11 methylase PrmA
MIQNRIEKERFQIFSSCLIDDVAGRFEVIVANITYPIISELLKSVLSVLSEKGILILSGIIGTSRGDLIEQLKGLGFHIIDFKTKEEWIALAAVSEYPGKIRLDPHNDTGQVRG